jgi:hypothetical protein
MSISDGHASMTPASVSDFGHLDPQQHAFAPNQTRHQPQHQQHMQLKHLLRPPVAVPPRCTLTPIPAFLPHVQHAVAPAAHNAMYSDFWAQICSDSLTFFEPLSPVYVPPIHPSILVEFMLSPDYSLLKSNPAASSPYLLDHLSALQPVALLSR